MAVTFGVGPDVGFGVASGAGSGPGVGIGIGSALASIPASGVDDVVEAWEKAGCPTGDIRIAQRRIFAKKREEARRKNDIEIRQIVEIIAILSISTRFGE